MTEPLAEDDGPDDDELERLTRYCDFWRKNGWAPSRPATIVETLAKLLKASRAEVAALEAERDALREALSPFALFASAIKGVRPQDDVITYRQQGLRANAFYAARAALAEHKP